MEGPVRGRADVPSILVPGASAGTENPNPGYFLSHSKLTARAPAMCSYNTQFLAPESPPRTGRQAGSERCSGGADSAERGMLWGWHNLGWIGGTSSPLLGWDSQGQLPEGGKLEAMSWTDKKHSSECRTSTLGDRAAWAPCLECDIRHKPSPV